MLRQKSGSIATSGGSMYPVLGVALHHRVTAKRNPTGPLTSVSRCRRDFALNDLQCIALDGRRCFASQFTQATAARNDDPMLVEDPTRCRKKLIPENARVHHVGQ
jgi:hypothetical protein